MLERGAQVPHFEVVDAEGRAIRYADLWQRQALVLVTLAPPIEADARSYIAAIGLRLDAIPARDTALVVTVSPVPSVPTPGVIVADRWGEVYLAVGGKSLGDLPAPPAVAEWVAYVLHECPECQGEAR